MRYIFHLATKYPLSTFLIVVIWVLCFCTPPHTRLNNVRFIDKWTHFIMYGGTCLVIWCEYVRNHSKRRPGGETTGHGHEASEESAGHGHHQLLIWGWMAPIVMSGVLELLQEYCTGGHRNGDWLDLAANATGVLVAAILGLGLILVRMRNEE